MNRTFGTLVALVIVAVAALAWWLTSSGRLEQFASNAGKTAATATTAPASPPDKSAAKAITSATEAIKDLGDRLGPPLPPASTDPAPAFDVARIAEDGEAVIAGRAVPGSAVELLVDGKAHDRTTADSSGAFVLVPQPLPPGNYDIRLRATAPDGKVLTSKNAVPVALRAKEPSLAAMPAAKTPVVAAPSAPETKTPALAAVAPPSAPELLKPREDAAAKPGPKAAALRIEEIEAEAGGGLFVSGRAAPGSRVRLYMNDGFIAMATASAEGRVAFSIQSGVRAGDYRIRLDQMSTGDAVTARVEKPFRAPAMVAAAPVTPAPALSPSGAAPLQTAPALAAAPQSPVVVAQKPSLPPATPLSPTPPQASDTPPSASPPVATAPQPAQSADRPTAATQSRVAQNTERSATQPAVPSATIAQPPIQVPATPQAQPPATSQPSAQLAATDRQAAQSPAPRMPASELKTETSPRIAERTNDRRDAVIIPSIDTRLIVRGDNLWRISEATYGLGQRYTVIFGANRDKIRNPHLIYPGQIFVLPKAAATQ